MESSGLSQQALQKRCRDKHCKKDVTRGMPGLEACAGVLSWIILDLSWINNMLYGHVNLPMA